MLEMEELHSDERISESEMLVNPDHIVSIKPINIVLKQGILKGYWIRLSNGKKYRASSIPAILLEMLSDSHQELQFNRLIDGDGTDSQSSQNLTH